MNVQLKSPKEMVGTSIEWFVMAVLVALALRFVFRLFGAEGGGDGFINWLYGTTDVLLQPVRGVFPMGSTATKYVVDFVALFAMLAYMVVGVVTEGVVNRWSTKRK